MAALAVACSVLLLSAGPASADPPDGISIGTDTWTIDSDDRGAVAPAEPTTDPPAEVPPPDGFTIDVVTVNGSGCPVGTAAVAVSEDKKAFTVTYSEFLAQIGVGSKPTDFRKNCQMNLLINAPQGFTYGIYSTDYRGFAALEKGSSAIQRANYYFQGMPQTGYISHTIKGPKSDNWQVTDNVEVSAVIYAPCGAKRTLNINNELRVAAGSSDPKKTTSFITMDSTDGDISTVYRLSWQRCE